jgi:hypothetical protein
MVGRQREFLVLQYGDGLIQVIWAKKTCPVTTYQGVVRRAEVNRLCRTIPPLRRIKIEATKVVIIGRSRDACLALKRPRVTDAAERNISSACALTIRARGGVDGGIRPVRPVPVLSYRLSLFNGIDRFKEGLGAEGLKQLA